MSVMILFSEQQRATEFAVAWRRLRRLPTIETQTIECLRILWEFGPDFNPRHRASFDLRRQGFQLYIRTGCWKFQQQPLWGLTIARVAIPQAYWGRGWFRNFSEILFHTMPHDLLIIESVVSPELEQALSRKPEYKRFRGDWFFRSRPPLIDTAAPGSLLNIEYDEFTALDGKMGPPDFCPPVTKCEEHRPAS
jgi:hypothetical protein